MTDLKEPMLPFDEEDLTDVKYYKEKDGTVKIVFYLDIPYFNVKLYVDGVPYTDGFNDKEPYDHQTHFFFVPEENLNALSVLMLTACSEPDGGDLYYTVVPYGNPYFYGDEELLEEYNSRIAVISEESENVCDGVDYTHYICKDKNGAPVHEFLLTVDTSKASLYIGTPNDGYEGKEVKAKVPEMIKSAVESGINAVAAVNADFFDMFGDCSPSGLCVKNGKIVANADSKRPFIGIKKDGTPRLTTLKDNPEIIDELECAASGLEMIVRDGKIFEWGPLEPFSYVRHPRTAAGLTKDGKVLLLVVDGRIPDYSNGATLVDLAEFMIEHGADRAVNLDGGGSSVIYTKKNGEFILHSNPADLFRPNDKLIREEFNCIIVTAKE